MSLEDDLASGSQFLVPHRPPPRQTLSTRRSKSSLHGEGATRGASLAHELAAALMPEPSAGTRLLADEFGIEFDEGAEGIDEGLAERDDAPPEVVVSDELAVGFEQASEWLPNGHASSDDRTLRNGSCVRQAFQDPLIVLNKDLQTTDLFIENLRRMDTDSLNPSSTSTHVGSSSFEPALERLALDIIRRINESAREREGQVRELREFEKEFKRIASQAGGNELLGELDELEHVDGFSDDLKEKEAKPESGPSALQTVEEEEEPDASADWELDPHRILGDEDETEYGDVGRSDSPSPVKESLPLPPPPLPGIPTPGSTVTQLAYMRSITQSLIQSLSTVVEHTQVSGAATAEAGRKIRALKNKLGGWRAESESAERSIERIERWEAAGGTCSPPFDSISPAVGTPNGFGSENGRKMKQIMQDELTAFELVLAEAGRKTQAIMAVS